jgi:hypothetical protein
MKDGLRGKHFPDNDAVLVAVRKWVSSAIVDFYEKVIQVLVHHGENA